MEATQHECRLRRRNLHYMATPPLWALWPFLAVVRRTSGTEEFGVLCDFFGATGKTGYGATVLFGNIFALPTEEAELLALRKEVYDTFNEVFDAGWRVD